MIRFVLDNEKMHPLVLGFKVSEEMGEWAEAMLYEHGYLHHKKLNEDIYDELADVFMIMLTATALTDVGIADFETHRPTTPEEVVDKFEAALKKKFEKYRELIEK